MTPEDLADVGDSEDSDESDSCAASGAGAMTRRFTRSVRRAPRRLTTWVGGPATGGSATAAGQVATIVAGKQLGGLASEALIPGLTIVRIRGELNFSMNDAASPSTLFGAIGFMIVPPETAAAGVVAVPGPWANEDDEHWMYHQYIHLRVGSGIAAGSSSGQFVGAAQVRHQIDSKAMRKFAEGDVIVAVLETGSITGGTFAYQLNTRMLVKLP